MRFPRDKDQYVLGDIIGTGAATTLYTAKHVNLETVDEVPVNIKIVNVNKIEDIYSFTKEIHEAESCDHENVVKVHCSFMVNDQLWIVMSPLPGFSLRTIILSSCPTGLPKPALSFILTETLKVVHYLHENDKLHRGIISADCIFLDENFSGLKFSFSSISLENSNLDSSSNGLPNWILAPEGMNDYRKGTNKLVDIWMFGLLALELFYGRFPVSDSKEFQLLLRGIEDKLGKEKKKPYGGIKASEFVRKLSVFSCFSKQTTKIIPRALGEVLAACLAEDPKKRPTTNQLLEFKFFLKPSVGLESLAKLKRLQIKNQ